MAKLAAIHMKKIQCEKEFKDGLEFLSRKISSVV